MQVSLHGSIVSMEIAASFWWFVLVLSTIAYFGYGIILMYHWFRYTLDGVAATFAALIYCSAGAVLCLTMASAILSM